jgi:hypothetical protein
LKKKILTILLSGVIGYFAALILFLKIYWPTRYLIYTLPIFLSLLFAVNFVELKKKIKFVKLKYFIALIFVLFIFSSFIFYSKPNLINCPEKELYDYFNQNKIQGIIFGFPRTMDCVYKFSSHDVTTFYLMDEFIPLFNPKRYEKFKGRIYDFFDVYYSNNISEIKIFCEKNNISHLLLERDLFSENYFKYGWDNYLEEQRQIWYDMPFPQTQKNINFYFERNDCAYDGVSLCNRTPKKRPLYFQPYDDYILNITFERNDFVLSNISENIEYDDGKNMVVLCDNLK